MTDIGDVIELIADIPDRNLRAGMRGTVVHRHTAEDYEIEFSDKNGETIELLPLRLDQFMVVWRASFSEDNRK